MSRTRLMNDRSDAMSAANGPSEEGEARNRHKVGLDSEEMADLVDREPDGRQREEPEQKKGHVVSGVRARARRHGVLQMGVAGPDGSNHEGDAFTSDPGLHAVPNASHCRTVEDGPERSPDTE